MPHNYTICTNASQYDYGVIGACFEDGMASLKTSCKITDINYGPLHVTSGQNTTRCPIVQTDICRFDHAIDSFHCQCPLQGTLTLYQSLWPFIFRLEIILPPQLIRTQEYLKFSANALQVSNPWQPDYRLWLRDILPPNAPISDKRGDLLRSVPFRTVWHWKMCFCFIKARAKSLKLWLVYVKTITKNMPCHLPGFFVQK